MKYSSKVVEEMIVKVNEEAHKPLNNFEEGFMSSITDKFDRSGYLSDREIEILEKIYCEKVP